jgi:predicted neuraminidase
MIIPGNSTLFRATSANPVTLSQTQSNQKEITIMITIKSKILGNAYDLAKKPGCTHAMYHGEFVIPR